MPPNWDDRSLQSACHLGHRRGQAAVSAPSAQRRQRHDKRRRARQQQARATAPTIDTAWGVTSLRTSSELRGGRRQIEVEGLHGLVRAPR